MGGFYMEGGWGVVLNESLRARPSPFSDPPLHCVRNVNRNTKLDYRKYVLARTVIMLLSSEKRLGSRSSRRQNVVRTYDEYVLFFGRIGKVIGSLVLLAEYNTDGRKNEADACMCTAFLPLSAY